jgi:hypothetical protein
MIKYNKNVKYIEDMKTAINEAVSYGTDVIIAFGSLSYLGEFKRTLKEIL